MVLIAEKRKSSATVDWILSKYITCGGIVGG